MLQQRVDRVGISEGVRPNMFEPDNLAVGNRIHFVIKLPCSEVPSASRQKVAATKGPGVDAHQRPISAGHSTAVTFNASANFEAANSNGTATLTYTPGTAPMESRAPRWT